MNRDLDGLNQHTGHYSCHGISLLAGDTCEIKLTRQWISPRGLGKHTQCKQFSRFDCVMSLFSSRNFSHLKGNR